MIVDLPGTTTSAVNKALVDLRESGGAVALGRVLTLAVVTAEDRVEHAVETANAASREHPCRVLVLASGSKRGPSRLDAQIRVGGDAGASEVLVLRMHGPLVDHAESVVVPLLLPDAPVVAWWPGQAPASPAEHPIGRMAQRRITDAAECRGPVRTLEQRAATYADGDSDLAWTRLTVWRGLLAAALDQPPYERVTEATVTGSSDSPSTDLLAAWLGLRLRCPITRARTRAGGGMASVRLVRHSGAVELVRPDGKVATLSQPGQPDRRISLPRRGLRECLSEELRRLDPDEVYGEVLRRGLPLLRAERPTEAEAEQAGRAPARAAVARKQGQARRAAARASEQMKAAQPAGEG